MFAMSRQPSPYFNNMDDESDTFLSGDVLNRSIDNDTSEDDTFALGTVASSGKNGIVGSPSSNSLASSCSTATRQHRPGSILDEKGYRIRAGCIALKFWGSDTQLLLTASTRHEGQWVLPAGGVEKGESTRQAAVREAQEEGKFYELYHFSMINVKKLYWLSAAGVDCEELEYLGEFDDECKPIITLLMLKVYSCFAFCFAQ